MLDKKRNWLVTCDRVRITGFKYWNDLINDGAIAQYNATNEELQKIL